MRKQKSTGEFLKGLFIFIGVVASISALIAVAYTLFKKYFQVTFECEGDDALDEDDTFAEEEDEAFEPILCCEEEEEAAEEEDNSEYCAEEEPAVPEE